METLEQRVGKPRWGLRHALISTLATLALTMPFPAKAATPTYALPENIVSLNTGTNEDDPEPSCDGEWIYFGRSDNPEDLMQATRSGFEFTDVRPIPGEVNTIDNAEANLR